MRELGIDSGLPRTVKFSCVAVLTWARFLDHTGRKLSEGIAQLERGTKKRGGGGGGGGLQRPTTQEADDDLQEVSSPAHPQPQPQRVSTRAASRSPPSAKRRR